jgi:hypothetical protein
MCTRALHIHEVAVRALYEPLELVLALLSGRVGVQKVILNLCEGREQSAIAPPTNLKVCPNTTATLAPSRILQNPGSPSCRTSSSNQNSYQTD